MDSYVSPKDEIWFMRVCHHISTGLYTKFVSCDVTVNTVTVIVTVDLQTHSMLII